MAAAQDAPAGEAVPEKEVEDLDYRQRRVPGSVDRYGTSSLIERYGADFAGPGLQYKLSADCEKHEAAEYEQCDLYFPNMLRVT